MVERDRSRPDVFAEVQGIGRPVAAHRGDAVADLPLQRRADGALRLDEHLGPRLVQQVGDDRPADLHDLGQFGFQLQAVHVNGLHQDPQQAVQTDFGLHDGRRGLRQAGGDGFLDGAVHDGLWQCPGISNHL